MAIALLTLSFLAQIVYKKNRVCFCVLFSFAATGSRQLKSSPRSQNHSIWNQQKYILWHYERSVRDVMIMTMIIIVIARVR